MALNLRSQHSNSLFNGKNFWETNESEEPPRKKQKTQQQLPDRISLNESDSELASETELNEDDNILFDGNSSTFSSPQINLNDDGDEELLLQETNESDQIMQYPNDSPNDFDAISPITSSNKNHSSNSNLSPIHEVEETILSENENKSSHLTDVSGLEPVQTQIEIELDGDEINQFDEIRSDGPSVDDRYNANQTIPETPNQSSHRSNSLDANQNAFLSPNRSNFPSPTRSRSNTANFDIHINNVSDSDSTQDRNTNTPNSNQSQSRSQEIALLQQHIVDPNAPSDNITNAQITDLQSIDGKISQSAHLSDDDDEILNDFENPLQTQQYPQNNDNHHTQQPNDQQMEEDEHEPEEKDEVEQPQQQQRRNHNHHSQNNIFRSPQQPQSRNRSVRSSSNIQNPGDRNHRVLSIIEYRNRKEIGVGVIDLTAPMIDLYQFTDKAAYSDSVQLIASLQPTNVLFPSTTTNNGSGLVAALRQHESLRQMNNDNIIHLRPLSRKYFNDSEGIRHLTEICTKESLKKLNLNDNTMWLALSALNAAICWLNHSGPRFAKHTVTLSYRSIDGYMKIDFETIKNLELVSNLKHPRSKNGTLLKALDFCQTKMGKRLLRSSLHQPLCNKTNIEMRLDVVDALLQSDRFYGTLTDILAHFYDLDSINNALSRIPKSDVIDDLNKFNAQSAAKFILKVCELQHNLNNLANLVAILNEFKANNALLTLWNEQFSDDEYKQILIKIETTIDDQHSFNPKASVSRQQSAIIETIKTGICSELDCAKHLYFDMERTLNDRINAMKNESNTNIPGMKLHFTASRGYHLCIPSVHKHRLDANIFIEQHTKRKNIYCTTSQILLLNQSLAQTHKEIMRFSQNVLNDLLRSIQQHMTSLHILSEYVAKLDMLCSFATYCQRISSQYTRPELNDTDCAAINFQNSKHPILERLSRHKIVENNVSIYQTRNLQIINGPNGSGKSTYIKQVALLCIMAHIGCFVPASFASVKLIDGIFSRLSNGDNLQLNQSSFFNECKDMNYILSNLQNTKNALVIIDELGRSTSSIDAYAFAWSCCEFLKCQKNVYTLFVTHFEMDRLSMYPNVICNKFRMKTENNKISYSYKLYSHHRNNDWEPFEDGYVAQQRPYGIIMAQMTGFPLEVIDESKNVLEEIRRMNVRSDTVKEAVPLNDLEHAIIWREHTETMRGARNMSKNEIIDVLQSIKDSMDTMAVRRCFLLLMMIYLLHISHALIGGLVTNIASSLLKDMMFTEHTSSNYGAEAQDFIKSVRFSQYSERQVAAHKQGLPLSKLHDFAKILQKRYGIPDNYMAELEDIELFDSVDSVMRDFIYRAGNGAYRYGRIAAVKRDDDKLDFAYWFYNVEFQLPPRRIEHKITKRFLGIKIGTKRHVELVPRELSEQEIDHFKAYFDDKRISEFKNVAPPSLLNAPNIAQINIDQSHHKFI